jgi:hypothetical protein
VAVIAGITVSLYGILVILPMYTRVFTGISGVMCVIVSGGSWRLLFQVKVHVHVGYLFLLKHVFWNLYNPVHVVMLPMYNNHFEFGVDELEECG